MMVLFRTLRTLPPLRNSWNLTEDTRNILAEQTAHLRALGRLAWNYQQRILKELHKNTNKQAETKVQVAVVQAVEQSIADLLSILKVRLNMRDWE